MALIDRMKEARVRKGLTQEKLAKEIGVAKSTYTGYEKGNSEPNMMILSRIMNVLEVDANFLFRDETKELYKNKASPEEFENLVKKYAFPVTNLKKITPHKLRSTYGTALYRETNDIYLVADVLGHKDINTTRKHYAALEEDKRRRAAKDRARRYAAVVNPSSQPLAAGRSVCRKGKTDAVCFFFFQRKRGAPPGLWRSAL